MACAWFAPKGTLLPEQLSVAVRYTGARLAHQPRGIMGASFAPSRFLIMPATRQLGLDGRLY